MRSQNRRAGLSLSIALAVLTLAPAAALAGPRYDLMGRWASGPLDAQGHRLAANGTADYSTMDLRTGRFSGTSVVSGIHFSLAGVERGANVVQTLTEGAYVSTDRIHLFVQANGRLGGTGSFTDTNGSRGNYWAELRRPGQGNTKGGKPTSAAALSPSFTSVSCSIFPSAPNMSSCTATAGDAGAPPRHTPTGSVQFTTSVGTFTAGDTCTLRATPGSPGVAACSVGYQIPPGTPPGALPVTAAYEGDSKLDPSTGGTGVAAGILGAGAVFLAANGTVSPPVANPNPAGLTGVLTLGGASFANGARAGAARAHIVGRASFRVGRFGVTRVKVKLSAAARRYLKKHRTLRVSATIVSRTRGRKRVRRTHLVLRAHRR